MQLTTATLLLALTTAFPSLISAACLEQPALGFPINIDITPTRSATISFQISPNAVGPCQLIAKFPEGYPIHSTVNDLVDVRALDGPAQGALVGSVRFRAGITTVINSFACRDVMGFELSIADVVGGGEVGFAEGEGAGVFMEVGDCSV